ncbi:MAG TPA: BON domain-containing protein [Pseudomonadales bacterium]|nr:BON domain-containing protein [Pseudomonadales bacterium]
MRYDRIARVLLVPAMLLMLAACAASPKHEATGEYIDDSVITTKVKLAIVEDDRLSATDINVETRRGEVQLSGFVSSQADIDRAVRVAGTIAGVKSVKNDMQVKEG